MLCRSLLSSFILLFGGTPMVIITIAKLFVKPVTDTVEVQLYVELLFQVIQNKLLSGEYVLEKTN